MGHGAPLEQGHERLGEGVQSVKEGLQGPLATEGIAKEQCEKVQHLIVAEPLPGKAHLGVECLEDATTAQMTSDEDNLGKPRGNRPLRSAPNPDTTTPLPYCPHT